MKVKLASDGMLRRNDITVKVKLTQEDIIASMYMLVFIICPIIVIAGACISETVGRSMLCLLCNIRSFRNKHQAVAFCLSFFLT